jgi:hydroxypyruvate isomerase
MYEYSACIEWLFAEHDRPFADRVRASAEAGIEYVEFWGYLSKPVSDLDAALKRNGVRLTSFACEPRAQLADPGSHRDFLQAVDASCRLAQRLQAQHLLILPGDCVGDVDRAGQLTAVAEAMKRAAPIAERFGIDLLIEPLNTRVDHPGRLIDSVEAALAVIQEAGAPNVKLLLDYYHTSVMGEDISILEDRGEVIGHVQVADVPGRQEPGTGSIDWHQFMSFLRRVGYAGRIGLEYRPSIDTASSLEALQRHAAFAGVLRSASGEAS